ncbi:MAG TPA: FtsX-like permease family protein [Acidimicrobiales bacterium]
MNGMRKVALRGLMAHKGRLVATFLAVALGVAFIGGVLTLTDTMNRTFDDLFADVYRDTDAVVRSNESISGNEFDGGADIRGTLPASVLEEVRNAEGVAAADGGVEGYAQVIDRDGDPVGDPAMGAPTFGGNWTDIDEINPFEIDDGRAPRAAGEIVIDRGTAEDTGFGVGDEVRVQTRTGVGEYTVVGITRFGTADNPGGASYVMWTTEEAQELVGEPGRFGSVAVVAEDGVSQRELVRNIEDHLESAGVEGTEVLTGQEITEETQSEIKESLSFLTTFFLAFAVIALFVGIFVIYNSFSIIVAQRTREMALLRAIGAARKQVRRAVLVEAVAVGLIGSVVGYLLGLGIAIGLTELMGLPEGTLAILPPSVAMAVLAGLGVTLVAALIPARRASRIPPLAAMREVDVDRSSRSLGRLIAGLVLSALGLVLVASGALGDEVVNVGAGVFIAFIGLALLSPALAPIVSGVLGRPLARLRGVSGAVAGQNAGRNPRRTSAAALALMIGVGVVAFVLVINASIRASIDESLEESFSGDFVVQSGSFGIIGLPTDVSERIAELPEVAVVSPLRMSQARVDGEDKIIAASNAGGFRLLDMRVVEASPEVEAALESPQEDLPRGTLIVNTDTAERDGLAIGDTVETHFLDDRRPEDAQTLTVGGIYEGDAGLSLGSYVIGLGEFEAAVPTGTDIQTIVQLADGVSVAEAEPAIERIVDPYPAAEVQSVEEFKDAIKSQLDILLNLIWGMLVIAIVIAMLGIANTIALSVLERTREIGLLRAVGMSRRQLRSAIRWESAIIAVFGTILGLAVGVLGGWGMVSALGEEGFNQFQIPFGNLLFISALAALMGMLAAVLPAWRASRLDVLAAIEST